MSRIPVPDGGFQHSPSMNNINSMSPAADTRRKQSKRDEMSRRKQPKSRTGTAGVSHQWTWSFGIILPVSVPSFLYSGVSHFLDANSLPSWPPKASLIRSLTPAAPPDLVLPSPALGSFPLVPSSGSFVSMSTAQTSSTFASTLSPQLSDTLAPPGYSLASSTSAPIPPITPPASIRSTSPSMPPPPVPTTRLHPTPNTITKSAMIPSKHEQPKTARRQSSLGVSRSSSFKTSVSAPSIPFPVSRPPTPLDGPNSPSLLSPTDDMDDSNRPRYHSSVSDTTLPRSESTNNFAGKLKSLRKKIESELSRKRPGSSNPPLPAGGKKGGSKTHQKGTVAGLRPSPALTVPESMTVADASQLCAAKRTDCVLVVDDEEGLSGIFTAKDLAFRVTAEGLDPRNTTVAQIMTKNPMVTRDSTSATEALQLMVSRGFRHLPVCNEDGDVVGLLDITKVFHEALAKVERGSVATSQLHAALAGVQTELGPTLSANPQAAAMMAYVDALRDRMALPDLTTLLDSRLAPPTVSPRTSVRDAARLMKERRTTAVCVMETNTNSSQVSAQSGASAIPRIAGIFTSKDIVLRVIAAGLDAARCSVVRVMTPHPDTAPPTMIVQDALKKMHNGHYLNLPVVEADGRLLGIVDVLKLTYATLEQIESMSESQSNDSGPMWGKFFETLGTAGADDDSVSITSHGDRPDTPSRPNLHNRGISSLTSPISEVMPDDSASAVEDDASELGKAGATSSITPAPLPVDDGTYIFKFRTPSGRTHRFQARHDSYDLLRDIVAGKLVSDPFFSTEAPTEGSMVHLPDPNNFTLSYMDDEGDLVTMTADGDVADAVRIARGQKSDRVVLLVDGGKVWEETARDIGGEKAVQALQAVETEVKEVEEDEEKMEAKSADPAVEPTFGAKGVVHSHGPSPGTPGVPELLFGFLPKEMALPAAVGFLGVVIVGVSVVSRTSKQ